MADEKLYKAKTRQEVEKEKIKFKRLDWCPNYEQPGKGKKGVFTMPDYEGDTFPGPPLLEHPYLSNRLFTNPPITEALVGCEKTDSSTWVKNANGVTIHDVYAAMTKE